MELLICEQHVISIMFFLLFSFPPSRWDRFFLTMDPWSRVMCYCATALYVLVPGVTLTLALSHHCVTVVSRLCHRFVAILAHQFAVFFWLYFCLLYKHSDTTVTQRWHHSDSTVKQWWHNGDTTVTQRWHNRISHDTTQNLCGAVGLCSFLPIFISHTFVMFDRDSVST